MSAINRRIQLLEQARPARQLHPPGVRTVTFEPFRGRNGDWPPGGFHLVELKPRKRHWPIAFETESIMREDKVRKRLISLGRHEQDRIAASLGYRVLYIDSL